MENIIIELRDTYGEDTIRINEKMSDHTSFKIGGPADCLCIPNGVVEFQRIFKKVKAAGLPVMIMGNGSNLLVPDSGLRGVVIKVCEGFKGIRLEGDILVAEAGCLLSSVASFAVDHALEGFEFASGIPGTLGGAVFMNAGAYGGEMKDVIQSVKVMDSAGEIYQLKGSDIEFAYRYSSIQDENRIVIEASLHLKKGNSDAIKERLRDLTAKRTSKQPLELPSAGSVFKRPAGHYAGQLIDESGLRGLRLGDAQVSTKHCGFIVNLGKSNYKEVTQLIRTVQKIVFDTFGIHLETEIRILKEMIE